MKSTLFRLFIILAATTACSSAVSATTNLIPVDKGWAKNSVNANILRHNSVVSHDGNQYVAFYAEDGFVVLTKRKLGSEEWEIKKTGYQGNVKDAHNSISIMVDGEGYLHMSWDHHNHPLRYCRSVAPGSLEMTDKIPMTGIKEDRVTYPEFYRLPDGNLLFLYRDGKSGRGSVMMNHYDAQKQEWTQLQDAFIHGEGKRNAYWQMCIDARGTIHISWVWRDTGDVATNHDMGYAKSEDGGKTWLKSDGEPYTLPITASTAEYAARIPQSHELINTTGMCADDKGRPYIATFFRSKDSNIPQYHIIYHDGSAWKTSQVSDRQTPFSLSGGGTKRKPISRPRIIADSTGSRTKAYLLFRDVERGNRVSVAQCDDISNPEWHITDLTDFSVDMWEPSYDTEMWQKSKVLHLYVQKVGQGDGETTEDIPPSQVSILEWQPEPTPTATQVAAEHNTEEHLARRVVENLLKRENYMRYGKHGLHYAEACAAIGAMRYCELVGDEENLARLKQRYDVLLEPGTDLISDTAHVDFSVIGAIPLQVYLAAGGERYLDFGLGFANRQWENPRPDGLTRETRWWVDDIYMVGMLQMQAYRATGEERYADRTARFAAAYLERLQQDNGLFHHGPKAPLFWGRGNGWVASGVAEALCDLPPEHPLHASILEHYRRMMEALLPLQAESGMWRQLLDYPEAWEETSCTAMFAYAMQTGVNRGWLKAADYQPVIDTAWHALLERTGEDGALEAICVGTGQSRDPQYYLDRPAHTGDFHGQAPLLWLAVERIQAAR